MTFVAITHAHPIDGLRTLVACYDEAAGLYNRGASRMEIARALARETGFDIVREDEEPDVQLGLYLRELLSSVTYFAHIHGMTREETLAVFDERRYWELLACRGRFFASLDPIEVNEIMSDYHEAAATRNAPATT